MKLRLMLLTVVVACAMVAWLVNWPDVSRVTPEMGCVPGTTQVYAMNYLSVGNTENALPVHGELEGGTHISIMLDGDWRETCVWTGPRKHSIRVALKLRAGTIDGSIARPQKEAALAELGSREFFVEIDNKGAIKKLQFSPEFSPMSRHIVREMLTTRSVSLRPNVRPGASWVVTDKDWLGELKAEYQLERVQDDGFRIVKRILEYKDQESEFTRGLAKPRPVILKHRTDVMLDFSSGFAGLASHKETELRLGAQVLTRASMKFELRLLDETETLSADARRAMHVRYLRYSRESRRTELLLGPEFDARLERQMQENSLQGDTWDTLEAKLAENGRSSATLFLKLRSLFILQPDTAKLAMERLLTMTDPSAKTYQLLLGALGSAGTPEAQAALVSLIEDAEVTRARQAAISLLGRVEVPTRESENALRRLLIEVSKDDPVHNTVVLALGNQARMLRTRDDDRYRALVDDALSNAQSAESLGDKTTVLAALGNTTAPRALKVLSGALSDERAQVRESAARALAGIECARATVLLFDALEQDIDVSVRRAAAAGLGRRRLSETQIERVTRHFEGEKAEQVRISMLRAISDYASISRHVLTKLQHLQDADPSPDVRRLASMTLSRLSLQG